MIHEGVTLKISPKKFVQPTKLNISRWRWLNSQAKSPSPGPKSNSELVSKSRYISYGPGKNGKEIHVQFPYKILFRNVTVTGSNTCSSDYLFSNNIILADV